MASHPAPFHRQRQSNKTLDPTGQTAKFLYTILKQLDLKNVDWNEVADSLDITNGHAARMRWSRFRAQIEGLDNSYSRKSAKKRRDGGEKRKRNKMEEDDHMMDEVYDYETMHPKKTKIETGGEGPQEVRSHHGLVRSLKDEPGKRITVVDGVKIHHPTITTIANSMHQIPNTYVPAQFSRGQNPTHTSNISRPMMATARPHPGQQQWSIQNLVSTHPYDAYRGNAMSAYNDHDMRYARQPVSYPQQDLPKNDYGRVSSQRPHYMHNTFRYPPTLTNCIYKAPCPVEITDQTATQTDQPAQVNFLTENKFGEIRLEATTQNATTEPVVNTQEQMLAQALAAQESYPWPYSEDDVSRYIHQASDVVRLASLTNVDTVKIKEEPKAVNVSGAVEERVAVKLEPNVHETA